MPFDLNPIQWSKDVCYTVPRRFGHGHDPLEAWALISALASVENDYEHYHSILMAMGRAQNMRARRVLFFRH